DVLKAIKDTFGSSKVQAAGPVPGPIGAESSGPEDLEQATFGGRRAREKPQGYSDTARTLQRQSDEGRVQNPELWKQKGLYDDREGNLRFEINDNDMRLKLGDQKGISDDEYSRRLKALNDYRQQGKIYVEDYNKEIKRLMTERYPERYPKNQEFSG